jgi:hypothetical protein
MLPYLHSHRTHSFIQQLARALKVVSVACGGNRTTPAYPEDKVSVWDTSNTIISHSSFAITIRGRELYIADLRSSSSTVAWLEFSTIISWSSTLV